MKKEDGRSISRDALENYRFQALKLRKKGWKVTKIAEACGLHVNSVSRWFVKSSKFGEHSLRKTKAKEAKTKLSINVKIDIIYCLKESAINFGFETIMDKKNSTIDIKRKVKIHISNICGWLKIG